MKRLLLSFLFLSFLLISSAYAFTFDSPYSTEYIDYRIFILLTAISVVFYYLYLQDYGLIFYAIFSGLLLIIAGLTLVGGFAVGVENCDHVISTATTTNETTTYVYTNHCGYYPISFPWYIQEAVGLLYIIIGLGTILSIHQSYFSEEKKR